jgi:hypothetical protein
MEICRLASWSKDADDPKWYCSTPDCSRRQHNPAPQENQILVTFEDKSTVDYILLVSRRKGYDLGDYIQGNFEWDDMLPCIDKINPEDCQFCDFREQCPDRVGEAK